jgi:hypothetical protein
MKKNYTKNDLQDRVNEILKEAERLGISDNYFFLTTMERYQKQMTLLKELGKKIDEYGATITKTNVKGSENIAVNPALTEYNKTSSAANGTVATLINIIKSAKPAEDKADSLAEFLDD